jgi:RNA polymerase sigma factor (sigma-70 family)
MGIDPEQKKTPTAAPVTAWAQLTDEECMVSYQLGEIAGFDELYSRHRTKVRGYLASRLRSTATPLSPFSAHAVDDLTQAAFFKLHTSRHQFDSKFKFLPWLFTITRTILLDALRAERRQPKGELSEELLQTLRAPENPTQESSSLAWVGDPAFIELTEIQQKAISLKYSDDLDFTQIAERLGTNPVHIRQVISRGIRKLRKFYEKKRSPI